MSPRSAASEPEPFHVLFVCTGNTCRSPLAEVIAQRVLERRGWSQVEVRSAGVAAGAGLEASGGALRVAREAGLSLEEHRSTPLERDLVDWADLILVMSATHVPALADAGAGDRTALLTDFAAGEDAGGGGEGIPDPFGGDEEAYRRTFRRLEALVEAALARLEPILAP